jgi:hypothetical protein
MQDDLVWSRSPRHELLTNAKLQVSEVLAQSTLHLPSLQPCTSQPILLNPKSRPRLVIDDKVRVMRQLAHARPLRVLQVRLLRRRRLSGRRTRLARRSTRCRLRVELCTL